ncbi:MAG TPA: CRTAC1 family protein [Planctomycetes bacterium]|nr:CRTAC1 family protein [Planctomycetota bacterium]
MAPDVKPTPDDRADSVDDLLDDEILDDESAERQQRRVLLVVVVFVLVAAAALWFVYGEKPREESEYVPAAAAPTRPVASNALVPQLPFREAATESGIDFVHVNGAEGKRLLPETMGSGVAFLDFDRDGDQDLFLVNSAPWDATARRNGPTQAFYVNEGGRFRRAEKDVGLDLCFFGMGTAVGDFDGDGWPDLYVTAVGENHLFRNVDGKRFEDVTRHAGVGGGDHWSTGAVFVDYDRDGDLDLMVLNYVTWSPEIDLSQSFSLGSLARAYGPPTGFQGDHPFLFQNQGDGTFKDVAEKAGLHRLNPATGVAMGKSLGVTVCDFDDDGWLDFLVSNDTVQNFAFRNLGDGRFIDIGADIGFAFDDKGNARGAMGISTSHYRNNDDLAVAVGNFANEMTAFYVNQDPENPLFVDDATSVGIGAPTRDSLTFGLVFCDLDLDGFQDMVCTNGHVEPEISRVQASQHHAQPMEVFWNTAGHGRSRFVRLGRESLGPDILKPFVGRGLAVADVDGDGDLDIVATENAGRPRLFLNEKPAGRFLRLDLRDADGRSAALGARVTLETSAGRQDQILGAGGSYLSTSEAVLTFGLGADDAATKIRILWPNGKSQTLPRLAAGRHTLKAPR